MTTQGTRDRSSFTVLEVMLATAITALVAGILVTVIARMSAGWARASGMLAATAEAERVVRLVTRDDGYEPDRAAAAARG